MAPPALPPVDKIDPERAWQPWQPSAADPWNLKWAGHLYRRAAFGGNLSELRRAVAAGPAATIDLLLKGKPEAAGFYADDGPAQIGRGIKEIAQLRGWWVYCMLNSGHPLLEKLTLFWHNHFATSVAKVTSVPLMYKQNVLLRQHALGKFEPFLQAMSKDAAMLAWLDSNSNIKGRANENYARELMELFSLGVGNYTEKDVREAARAFTGWGTNYDDYEFNRYFHDNGAKTVLGQTGNFNGDDVVRIVLKRPVAARFLLRKLYRDFVSEQQVPPDSLIEPLADSFRKSDYDIADLMRTMLSSRHFFSGYAFRQRIKNPVEYVLGSVRAVYRKYEEDDPNYSKLPIRMLVSRIDAMGQPLFAPPNVKGWRGGEAWLTTSTMLARQNFAQAVAMGTLWPKQKQIAQVPRNSAAAQAEASEAALAEAAAQAQQAKKPQPKKPVPPTKPEEEAPAMAFDPARILQAEKVTKPEDVVRVLLDVYLPGGVSPSSRTKLVAFVAQGNPTGDRLKRRAREAVQAILGMPESQLA